MFPLLGSSHVVGITDEEVSSLRKLIILCVHTNSTISIENTMRDVVSGHEVSSRVKHATAVRFGFRSVPFPFFSCCLTPFHRAKSHFSAAWKSMKPCCIADSQVPQIGKKKKTC